jgi:hypothetical protein
MDIQSMQIAPEEITYLVQEMARRHQERPPGEVDFYTALAILADRYRVRSENSILLMA